MTPFFEKQCVSIKQCGRIRDVYPGSRTWFLPIPDPGFRIPDSGSRISDPGSKNSNKRQGFLPKKLSASLQKYVFGIRDPGVKKAPDPGSATLLLRESYTRFFTLSFFHESVSPGPPSIPLGPFQIFLKIRLDIHKWMFLTVPLTLALLNLPKGKV